MAMTSESKAIMVPCKFFQQGRCNYGASCKNSHEAGILNTPVPNSACWFFLQGKCTFGTACRKSHEISSTTTAPNTLETTQSIFEYHPVKTDSGPVPTPRLTPNLEQDITDLADTVVQLSDLSSFSKDFNGASVTFETGAQVSSVKLSFDFSRVQISGLSPHVQPKFVAELLLELGFEVPESNIMVKSLSDEGSVAEVKVEDPNFAKAVTRKFGSRKHQDDQDMMSRVSFKPMIENSATGALSNRLQLSTVTCTWYKPSRSTYLEFMSRTDAIHAKAALESSNILGRTPTCSLQPQPETSQWIFTLQVSNLDIRTQKRNLEAVLVGPLNPERIILGKPSYTMSDTQASEVVEELLRSKGGLESFQWQVLAGNSKIKATATFSNRDAAAKSVRWLNNTKIASLGYTKLLVGHVISVKYNVPNAILDALKKDINELRENIWQNGHVHLKIYPQTEPKKPTTAVRVFGESLKHVADAKATMEKILAGTVVMDGDSALWDSYLTNSNSFTYLNDLSKFHKLHIHRDAQKHQLLLFGGSESSRSEVEQLLTAKIRTVQQLSHTIILTPKLLSKALQGGMRRLKSRFGAAVTLNVSVDPKMISIIGPVRDLQEAHSLLLNNTGKETDANDCVICWTEATNPLRTTCGHIYCKDCFTNQVSSVGDGDIPVRCCGGEGKCNRIFTINELKTMLSHAAFEELLESSFEIYIRTHPKDFQHCPTPDCPQIHRITTTGGTILCSTCLTLVCTTCNVAAHDGITCEEFKELISDGMEALEKWKKENDVRDCPNCKTSIEKSFGCNHMECRQCSTHICWFCMENFGESSECYAHMGKVHQVEYEFE